MRAQHIVLLLVGGVLTGVATADNPNLACFIDTPSYDQYTDPCYASTFEAGDQSIASFQVFGLDSNANYSFDWSDPQCHGVACWFVPISAGERIDMSVEVTNLDTNVTTVTSTFAKLFDIH